MARCMKCGTELISNQETHTQICPKCGKKYITSTTEEFKKLTDDSVGTETKNLNSVSSKPQPNNSHISKSLYEQFRAEIKERYLVKPKWLLYLIAIALIIACLVVCATPIAYNTEFINEGTSNQYSIKYIFKRNNICQIKNSYGTVSIDLYYFEDNAIGIDNDRAFKIINRTTIESSNGHTYKADNGAEIFLIVLTVLWSIFSIAFAIFDHKKKMTKPDRLRETK